MLKLADLGGEIEVYLKVNSGMNRLGFRSRACARRTTRCACTGRCARCTLMTHFADADGAGGVKAQLAWLEEMARPIEGLAHAHALARQLRGADPLIPRRAATGCGRASCSTAARRSPTRARRSSS